MRTRISLGPKLVRETIILIVFGCLLAGVTIFGQAANGACEVSNPDPALSSAAIIVTGICASDVEKAVLTTRVEISAQDDFEFAIEDDVSVEMSRPDAPERISGIDRAVVRAKDISRIASEARPNISAPLLE